MQPFASVKNMRSPEFEKIAMVPSWTPLLTGRPPLSISAHKADQQGPHMHHAQHWALCMVGLVTNGKSDDGCAFKSAQHLRILQEANQSNQYNGPYLLLLLITSQCLLHAQNLCPWYWIGT